MTKYLFALVFQCVLIGAINSQEITTPEKAKQLPSAALGVGILTFDGDLGNGIKLSKFSKMRSGMNLTVEERIGKYLGVSLSGLYGKLSDNESSQSSNLNFESKIIQADLCVVAHFDNDYLLKRNSIMAPYVLAGIGFLKFDPHGDLTDAQGRPYHYWRDGSIRDIDESAPNYFQSVELKRDYTYETQLKDSLINYKRSSLSFPLGLGVKLKLAYNIDVNLGATYYVTMTDWIDNVKTGRNDKYLFTHFALQYNFGKMEDDSRPQYKAVDFSALDKMDTDGDGIKDKDDRCPGTPKGVKTDPFGCPWDSDEDGVPNFKDRDPYTAPGAVVDEFGSALSDSTLAARQMQFDSVATERSKLLYDNPTLAYLYEVENKTKQENKNNSGALSKIPGTLKPADKNNDGFISTDEITGAIDSFFDGDSSFTVEKLNDLIDFFFEQ